MQDTQSFGNLLASQQSRVGTDLGRSNHGFFTTKDTVTLGALVICPAPMLCASQKKV